MREEYGQKQDVLLCPVKRISVVYNLKKAPSPSEPDDKYEEYDPISTVQSVADTLSSFGFHVSLCEQDENFFDRLKEQSPSFVATLAEGRGNARGREAQVPSVLESLDIPFWGSDSVSLALALDKLLTSRTLAGENIPVPLAVSFRAEEDLGKIPSLFQRNDRFVIKPRFEGSSKGIFTDSVAHDPSEMEEKIRRLWHRYGQPALAEEYLPGDEITVGILGNEKPRIAGMMRISPSTPGKEFLYSLEEKRNYLE
ncbi:MAG: D-alanine--D-alanine ligase, partial [Synergistaceae bacterium]|nr:D-alanine--D-alanine ligase [Synergistaceae bacterium]